MGINRVCVLWKRETAKEFFKMKKNTCFVTGMLAILLVFGLVLGGCPTKADDDDDGNPFEGKWTGTASIGGERADATINVTDSAWTFSCPDAGMSESGTYTRSGNTATLTQDGESFGTAAVSGSSLVVTITSGDYKGGTGTFSK
jgi:hypothetical protein